MKTGEQGSLAGRQSAGLRGWPPCGVLLLLAVSCLVTGCGLPDDRPVLPPPTDPSSSDTSDTFSFSQPTGTERVRSVETFGYEVYYRFSEVGESTDRNLVDRVQLNARQFVRLAGAGDRHPIDVTERPLLAVPSAARASHRVTLSFDPLADGEDPFAELSAGGSVSLRRGAADTTTGLYERFVCDRFLDGHPDAAALPELASDCAGRRVQLQLYAVAYGRDADRKEQFSEALYLGSIDLTFP